MRLLVLDAGVAAKWFLPVSDEPLVEQALDLLRGRAVGEITLTAPDLFWAEFASVLRKAVKFRGWPSTSAAVALARMRSEGLSTVPSEGLIEDALAIALDIGRSVYDCLYIALARLRGCEFITADEKLAKAVAPRLPVRWLGAF